MTLEKMKRIKGLLSVGSEYLVYTQKVAGSNQLGPYKILVFGKVWKQESPRIQNLDEKNNSISDKVKILFELY